MRPTLLLRRTPLVRHAARLGRHRPARRAVLSVAAAGVLAATALGSGAAAAGSQPYGPDVASYQHPNNAGIDMAAVRRSGASFVFVKATEGTGYVNPYFAGDYANARTAGLYRGAYSFARPGVGATNPISQADYLVRVAGTDNAAGDLPFVLDLEVTGGLSPAQLVAWAHAWLREVTRLTGRDPIIYSYPSFWRSAMANDTGFTGYPLWIADYRYGGPSTPLPGGWAYESFWQYTDAARYPGMAGPSDSSLFNGSASGLTRFATPPAAPVAGGGPAPAPGPLGGLLHTLAGVTGGTHLPQVTPGAVLDQHLASSRHSNL